MSSRQAEPLTRYHKVLFTLLCVATLFEGFDTKLSSLLLPLLGEEFDAGPQELGNAIGNLGIGAIFAFFVIRLADRFGRRPLMLMAVGGYASLTLATIASQSLNQFVAIQFAAKTLLVTQLALGYVILSEELPARHRGFGNSLLGAFASVGAALPALFLPGFLQSEIGWRGLFVLGALPLLVFPVLWRVLRETPAFERRTHTNSALIDQARAIVARGLLGRLCGATLLWFTVNLSSVVTMAFFTYYVFEERGWTAEDLQLVVPAAVPFAFLGYAAGGRLADRIGRRATAAIFLLAATLVANIGYRAESYWVIAGSWVALQMLQGIWPVAYTITAELFPTEMRAGAGAFAHNLVGRLGLVLGPKLLGTAAVLLGSTGEAVALLSFVNFILVPAFLLLVPETLGNALDDSEPDEV